MTMTTKKGADIAPAKDAKAPAGADAEGSKKKDLLKGADNLADQEKKLAPAAEAKDAKKGAKTPG